jgi:hypothetical protein
VQYLADAELLVAKCPAQEEKHFLDPAVQLHALTHRAARLVNDTGALLANKVLFPRIHSSRLGY